MSSERGERGSGAVRPHRTSGEGSPLLAPHSPGKPKMTGHNGPSYGRVPREDEDSGELQEEEDEETEYYDGYHDDGAEHSKSTWYLVLLTIAIGGLQMVWCVELASVSPFLLSLGISKSIMALVWIAGPLSGTLVQPYIGIRSDDCRLRWGRRRPFMVGGAVATVLSLMALAWTRELVEGFLGFLGAGPDSNATRLASQIFAVIIVYVLDFAINVVQAGIRAFIVDCAPTHQQEDANAWASRITGIGNIVGYLSGYVHLPTIFPFLGYTQFQVLCAIACVILSSTMALSCSTVTERDPRLLGEPSGQGGAGVISFFINLYHAMRRLPLQIRRVCQVQLFAWVAWFPFLFYITTWIGGIYAEPYFRENPNMTKDEVDAVLERGTRLGAFALLIFAITTFASSVILPFLVVPTYQPLLQERARSSTPLTPSASHSSLTNGHLESTHSDHGEPFKPTKAPRSPSRNPLLRFLSRHTPSAAAVQIPNLTLRRAWQISLVFFCILMWATLFVSSAGPAIALVSLVGIPWALTNWAPFALIAGEISSRDAVRRRGVHVASSSAAVSSTDERAAALGAGADTGTEPDRAADQAGVVLGIHNVAIAAPQIIATLVSSGIFALLQKPRGQPGDHSVGWVLRIGSVCALGAAWWCRYLGEGVTKTQDDGRDSGSLNRRGGGIDGARDRH